MDDATQVIDTIGGPDDDTPPRRRRTRRIVLIVLIVLAVVGGGSLLASGLYLNSVENRVGRVDAFTGIPEASRPSKAANGALNILILGSDTRDPQATSGSRSDTIILAHLPKDRSSVQLISIPRDTWVHIPKAPNGKYGDTDAKINAAFAWGGVALTVETIEQFTGVRIDNVALVDFSGFKEIVDALGGIEINVEQDFTSTHSLNKDGHRTFHKGLQTMDGATALDYARERYSFKDGDFARIRHQQQVIKAIVDKAASGGLLANPARLNDFLKATADAVTVDKTLSIFTMANDLRHLRSGSMHFYTSPSKGTGMVGDQSVVFADRDKASRLFDAIRRDEPDEISTILK